MVPGRHLTICVNLSPFWLLGLHRNPTKLVTKVARMQRGKGKKRLVLRLLSPSGHLLKAPCKPLLRTELRLKALARHPSKNPSKEPLQNMLEKPSDMHVLPGEKKF